MESLDEGNALRYQKYSSGNSQSQEHSGHGNRRAPWQCPITHRRFEIRLYENSLQVIDNYPDIPDCEPPTRKEGDISTFSRKSRGRLFKKLNMIELSILGTPTFVTVTYHREFPITQEDFKRDVQNYLKRLKRNLPEFHYIWRVELQKRGAPHFHMILFPVEKDGNFAGDPFRKELVFHWMKINSCGCADCWAHGVDVEELSSFRKTSAYVSKYVAKVDNEVEAWDYGRVWGCSTDLPMNYYAWTYSGFETAERLKKIVRRWLRKQSGRADKFAEFLEYRDSYSIYFFGDEMPWELSEFFTHRETFYPP